MIPAPLLVTQYQFLAVPDTRSTYIFLAVGAGLVILLTVGGILIARRNRYLDPQQRRRYSRFVFEKMARNIGLAKHHIEYLDYLIRVCKVKQPFLVFSNSGLLDDILRKGIYSLQQNAGIKEEERERRMSHLFQIKQIIERNAKRGIGIKSSNFLKIGQPVVITPAGGAQYQSKVMSNMRDMLACSAPKNESGTALRWPRGTAAKMTFWREGDAGYTFESKVMAYDTIKGVPCLLIQHSKTLRREQQRKFRRSTLNRPCFFYPVHIVEQQAGRKTERKAMVQANRRLLGYLLDISAGGCSITSQYPLKSGSLCKVEFEIDRKQRITIFGKVKRTRGLGVHRGGIMHLMFTTLSSRHLNQIYSYVYDYTSPRTTAITAAH